jgi:hypothetical protein
LVSKVEIETEALPGEPLASEAVLTTKLPTAHVPTFEESNNVAGREQSPIVPTFQFTEFPDKETDPWEGVPTTATLLMQVGTLSVTCTFWLDRVETVKLRNAVWPLFAWKPKEPDV